jgi:hypothetical protein
LGKKGERETIGENGDIGGEEGIRAEREMLGKEESKEGHGFWKEERESYLSLQTKILRMCLLVRRILH